MAVVSPLAKFNVVFVGDQSVGKTNIIYRFMYDKFDTTYKPTIGIDVWSRTMPVEDTQIQLQLRDTAGHERFRILIPSYIKDSAVAVIIYDVANRQSFLNTTKWIEEVRKGRGTDVIIVLVGNKCDLVEKRQVTVEEGDDKAREFGFIFIETSAKSRFNIMPLFRKIVAALWGMETTLSTKQEDMVGVKSGNMSNSHVSSSDTSNTQEVAKTNNDNSSENEIKDEEVDDEEKDTKGKGRCEFPKVYDDILKRMEEMHREEVRHGEEMHIDMLKRMEEMRMRIEKMHKDMLKRMEEMHQGMFRSIIKEEEEEEPLLLGDRSWYLLEPSELEA